MWKTLKGLFRPSPKTDQVQEPDPVAGEYWVSKNDKSDPFYKESEEESFEILEVSSGWVRYHCYFERKKELSEFKQCYKRRDEMPEIPEPGQTWESKKDRKKRCGSPFVENPYHLKIQDVKSGWVKYKSGNTSLTNPVVDFTNSNYRVS